MIEGRPRSSISYKTAPCAAFVQRRSRWLHSRWQRGAHAPRHLGKANPVVPDRHGASQRSLSRGPWHHHSGHASADGCLRGIRARLRAQLDRRPAGTAICSSGSGSAPRDLRRRDATGQLCRRCPRNRRFRARSGGPNSQGFPPSGGTVQVSSPVARCRSISSQRLRRWTRRRHRRRSPAAGRTCRNLPAPPAPPNPCRFRPTAPPAARRLKEAVNHQPSTVSDEPTDVAQRLELDALRRELCDQVVDAAHLLPSISRCARLMVSR
jgi:hypothetical protein